MKFRPVNKIVWTKQMESFLIKNYEKLTNHELAAGLGLKITSVRMKLYSMGFKRMELEYWTTRQVNFLKANYKEIGDVELTDIFNKKWPKQKGWTKKHIEKKRRQLNLKRTKTQIKNIHQRNVDAGRFLLYPVKRWDKCGRAKEGEIRFWRENSGRFIPRIKIGGRFIFWARYTWEQNHGPIPKGMNVVFKDNNPRNMEISNLELITDGELSRRNSKISSQGLSDNYVAGIMTHGDPELREKIKSDPELVEFNRQRLIMQRNISQLNNKFNHGKKQAQ